MLLYACLSRIVCFALAFLLFPRRIVPLSVRFSFVVVVVLFYSPHWLRLSLLEHGSVVARSFVVWEQVVVEGIIGLSAALFMMGFIYVGMLLARWIGQLLFAPGESRECSDVRESSMYLLEGVIVFYVLLMLSRIGFFPKAFSSFGEVMVSIPLFANMVDGSGQVFSTALLLELVKVIGGIAIQQAFFLALPVFAGIFLVDIFYVVLNRFVRKLATNEIILGTKLPAIVFVLATIMYPLSDRIAQLCMKQVEQGMMVKLFSTDDQMRGQVLKIP